MIIIKEALGLCLGLRPSALFCHIDKALEELNLSSIIFKISIDLEGLM